MTDVLIITNYYPPESGAAANRIKHLAEGLNRHGKKVSIICPLPNYPNGKIFEGYRGAFQKTENLNGINVIRLWVKASNSKNKFVRLISMLSFSFSLFWFFLFNKIPNTVIVQSPPLIVAYTSVLFLRSKKRKLILNISDLWPSAGLELGAFKKNWSYSILKKIERFNYRNASVIMGQSKEIVEHIKVEVGDKECLLYRNYPDFNVDELIESSQSGGKIKLVYAGLLGVAQGIDQLIRQLDYSNIEFHIYGSGAENKAIQTFIETHPELPIIYHGAVSREALHIAIQQYDLVIIPLLNRIYGSVPSKIFEFSKLGMPILYFGGGEGEDIVSENDLGWVAEAGNYKRLNNILNSINRSDLEMDKRLQIKQFAETHFDFESQIKQTINSLESSS